MAWTGCVSGALTASFLSLFLLAVGFSIPFWTSFEQKDVTDPTKTLYNVYVGVWYLMVCKEGESNSCASEALEPHFVTADSNITFYFATESDQTQEQVASNGAARLAHFTYWWAIQIVTTISLGLVLLASLILLCCRCAGIHSKGFFVISAILMLFGGLCALAIAIVLAVALGTKFTFIHKYEVTGETFPWSALVFGLGGLLAILAGFMIFLIVFKWKRHGAYFASEDEDEKYLNDNQQMSNLSKSYDRPRNPYNARNDYNGGYEGRGRDFSQSKKYREKDYDTRDYNNYNNRGYEPSYDRNYDRGYDQSRNYEPGRSYDKSYADRGYTGAQSYSPTRLGDTMYRPYSQPRY